MTEPFRADLHCHTNCSDGSMSPEELMLEAKKMGLHGLSITDHDTVAAYQTAIPLAKELGLQLGSGVEFSSVDNATSVHILGYDIDIEHKAILALCQRHIERRKMRNRRIVEKLKERGILIEIEEGDKPYGRPHIAKALVQHGVVRSIDQAFKQLIGDGQPCFDPGTPISTDETIEVIHQAGGKAFIAHPHLIRSMSTVKRLLEKPFDGIECYYSKCHKEQERRWILLAEERGLLMSGGSDFHGTVKPGIPLGASWVDRNGFDKIFEKCRWS